MRKTGAHPRIKAHDSFLNSSRIWVRKIMKMLKKHVQWTCVIIFTAYIYFTVINSYLPHSVQTLYGCIIYETAQNPGGLSLLPLPVKVEQ